MTVHPHRRLSPVSVLVALVMASPLAFAGRPLTVDDANVNDPNKGHVELWQTHASGIHVFTVAPAYAPTDGLELAALFARENSADVRQTALQMKWRITPSQEDGCNLATSGGVAWTSAPGIRLRSPYLNGLATCNFKGAGSLHMNIGVVREDGGGNTRNGGIAFERELGSVTGHVEWFGSQGSKPTLNIGLRGMLTPSLQLDGSVGRSDGETITTLGLKVLF